MSRQYSEIAPFYDFLMQEVDYVHRTEQCRHLCALYRKDAKKVLELGCGTGEMTRHLLRFYDIVAVERSEAMIDVARRKLSSEPNLRLLHADMRDFETSDIFDAAFAVYDVFNCLIDDQSLCRALQNIRRHLRIGAPLIFDVNLPKAFELDLFDEELQCPEHDYRHLWKGHYEPSTGVIRVEMTLYHKGEYRFETQYRRALDIPGWKEILERNDFSVRAVIDQYTGKVPENMTDRAIVCAVKEK